jgi:hypothetical protein
MNLGLCLALGLPTVAFLVNIGAGIVETISVHARLASFENNMNARFSGVESRFTSLESRFDTLIGKVIEIDNRR